MQKFRSAAQQPHSPILRPHCYKATTKLTHIEISRMKTWFLFFSRYIHTYVLFIFIDSFTNFTFYPDSGCSKFDTKLTPELDIKFIYRARIHSHGKVVDQKLFESAIFFPMSLPICEKVTCAFSCGNTYSLRDFTLSSFHWLKLLCELPAVM